MGRLLPPADAAWGQPGSILCGHRTRRRGSGRRQGASVQRAHDRSGRWVAARAAVVIAIALGLHDRVAAASSCLGDCVDSGYVTVVDLVRGVYIALGAAPLETCPNFDNGGGVVTIDVLITAVGHALHSCPRPPISTEPLPTSTPSAAPADPVVDRIAGALGGLCEPAEYSYAEATRSGYYAFCSASAGQFTTVQIDRFDDRAAAAAAFAAASRVGPPFDFEALPAAYWERGYAGPSDGGTRTMVWQLDCLVATVYSADNIGRLAVAPAAASRAIFDAAAELLTEQCPEEHPPPTPSPTKGPGPDLVVERVSAYANNDSCQPYVHLSVCLANAGREAAGPFAVTVAPGGDHFTASELASGGGVCAVRPFAGHGSPALLVTADADQAVDESDEANNALAKDIRYPTLEATCVPTPVPTPGG